MVRPASLAAIATAAFIIAAPALAQTGNDRPSREQHLDEQRATVTLSPPLGAPDATAIPYDLGVVISERDLVYEGAAVGRAWQILAEACNRGDRAACEHAGEMASNAVDDGSLGSPEPAIGRSRGAGALLDSRMTKRDPGSWQDDDTVTVSYIDR